MQTQRLFLSLLIGSLISGCSPINVRDDYDPSISFSGMSTYSWLKAGEREADDNLPDNKNLPAMLDGTVHLAVDGEMHRKGLVRVDNAKPDFLVAYHFAETSRKEAQYMNEMYAWSDYPWMGSGDEDDWWFAGGAYRWSGEKDTLGKPDYEEGTLIVDVLDPKTRKVIWRGTATDKDDFGLGPQDKEAGIKDAVNQILKDFPPKAKSR